MLFDILGAGIGVITAGLVVAIVEALGHKIFPPPEGMNLKDPEQLKTIMHTIPIGAKISVLIAWGVGVLTGGCLAIYIAGGTLWPAYVVAAFMLAGGLMTMIKIPHPPWMIVGAFVVTAAAGWGAGALMS